MPDTPTGEVTVRMYDVGFGDCFLLEFGYEGGDTRRVMIDCGTKALGRSGNLGTIVRRLVEDCAGSLDAMVFTHRHSDHLSALSSENCRERLWELDPKVIVLPWTEDPRAPSHAEEPSDEYTDEDRRFVDFIAQADKLARRVEAATSAMKQRGYYDVKGQELYNEAALQALAGKHSICS